MDQQQQQQPAPPRVSFEEIAVWIDEHKKVILGVIALIGIGGLVFVVRQSGLENQDHQATAALFELQAAATSVTNEPTAAQYKALLPRTEGTGIAQHVKLREAASLFAEGKYAEAAVAFESFIKDFPSSPLQAEANLGLATSLEAQNKLQEALVKYQELTTRYPQSTFVDRARLGQARIYEKQGDQQQAFRIYEELASRSAGAAGPTGQPSPLQIDANIAARRLLKENPGLMKTNAPSAAPSIAPTQLPVSLPKPSGS